MAEHWQELVANLAVVALFISTWVHGQFVFAGRPKWQRNVGFGTVMGLGAVASMLLAIPIDGALFDLRLSLLAIAGFFGGPIAGAAAVAIASICRLGLVGGANAPLAVVSMSMMAVVGWAISRSTRRRAPALVAAGLLALAPFVVSMGWSAVLHLPNTDEDAALFVADAFREALHALKLPHTGSERGMVTASVGIAALTPDDIGLDGPSLVARADEALYTAKHAGRDRVTGWRARHPAPQQQRA